MDPFLVARRKPRGRRGRPSSIPDFLQPLLEELFAEGLSMPAIARALSELDPPVLTSPDSVGRRLAHLRAARVEAVEAAWVEAGCTRCGVRPRPEAHRCGGRWVLWPGRDGLVGCPTCLERLDGLLVLEHLGARWPAGALLPMDEERDPPDPGRLDPIELAARA